MREIPFPIMVSKAWFDEHSQGVLGLNENEIVWDDDEQGRCKMFVPAFEKEINFVFFSPITPKMRVATDDVISLSGNAVLQLTEMLWEECQFAFTVADFGYVAEGGETHLEAHLRGFGVLDEKSAYDKSTIIEIQINDNDLSSRYAIILLETVSKDLINVIVKDGEIIDYDADGTHLGWFEDDEQYAHKKRQATLAKIV